MIPTLNGIHAITDILFNIQKYVKKMMNMNTQEKIQKVEKKIRFLLNEMGSESSAGQILNNHTMFKIYMERLEELKNELK